MNEDKFEKIMAQKIITDIDTQNYRGFVLAGAAAPVSQVRAELLNILVTKKSSIVTWEVNKTALNFSAGDTHHKNQLIVGTAEDIHERDVEKIDYLIIDIQSFFPNRRFFKLLSKFKPRIILMSGRETSSLIHLEFFKQFLSSRKTNEKRRNLKWMSMIIL